jgi:hypothetical protein
VRYEEQVLLVDRDQVEDENAPAVAWHWPSSNPSSQDGYAGIAAGGRDAVTGHSVGYELIMWISRPIGTGRDETVVPVTSRVRRQPSL